jgi:hypothetical protein
MSTFIGGSTYTRAPPTHRSPLWSNKYRGKKSIMSTSLSKFWFITRGEKLCIVPTYHLSLRCRGKFAFKNDFTRLIMVYY